MRKTFLFILLLSIFISPVYAFEDTFQDHPSDDLEQGDTETLWYVTTSGSEAYAVIQTGTLPYQKVMKISAGTAGDPGQTIAGNIYPDSSNYLSYVVKGSYFDTGVYSHTAKIIFYDSNGYLIDSITMSSQSIHKYPENTPTMDSLYEFIFSNNNIYLYIDGVLDDSVGSYMELPRYVEFDHYSNYRPSYLIIDSISFDGYTVGIGTEESPDTYININSDNEIDVEYTINTISLGGDWNDDYTYTMYVKYLNTNTIVNTTVMNESLPHGYIEYNRSTLMGLNYGVYEFYYERSGQKMASDYLTFLPIGESASIVMDQDTYVSYDDAVATYSLSGEDFSTYNYYVKILDDILVLQNSTQISSISGSIDYEFYNWDVDTYITLVSKVHKTTGTESYLGFDVFDIREEVRLHGITYYANDMGVLDTVLINDTQNVDWFNTTSDVNGTYSSTGLSDSITTYINAVKTNYTHENFTFYPYVAQDYEIDRYLFLSNQSFENYSIIEGVVVDDPLHQAVDIATVGIYNATWSDTLNTSNGYYNFTNLINGYTYYVNATATGYEDSEEYEVTVGTNSSTVQNIVLGGVYALTVTSIDSSTGASILTFTSTVNGESVSTTTGTATFNLSYGLYTISVSSSGYYPSSEGVFMDQDRSEELSLNPVESPYYAPTYVKFVVTSFWGTKYPNVLITAYNYGSTTAISTATTGNDGAAAFNRSLLLESNRYTLTFVNATQGIDESRTLYPVEDTYYIIVSTTRTDWDYHDVPISDGIDFGLSTSEINNTHAYINVSYNDTLESTTGLTIYVNQTDGYNQTIIDTWTPGAINSGSHSFEVLSQGQSYYVRVIITHSTYGTIDNTYTVSFPGEWYANFAGIPSFVWVYGSIFMLLFTGAFFVASNVEKGMLIVSIEGAVFSGLGLWDSLPDVIETNMNIGIILAFLISVAALLSKHQKGEGYT